MSANDSTQPRQKLFGVIAAPLVVAALDVAAFIWSQTLFAIPAINVDAGQVAIHGYDAVAYSA